MWKSGQHQTVINRTSASSPFATHRTETKPVVSVSARMRHLAQMQASSGGNAAAGVQSTFSVGQNVEHDRFGRGVVTAVEGNGDDIRVSVDFEAVGSKHLLLKFARLRKVEA